MNYDHKSGKRIKASVDMEERERFLSVIVIGISPAIILLLLSNGCYGRGPYQLMWSYSTYVCNPQHKSRDWLKWRSYNGQFSKLTFSQQRRPQDSLNALTALHWPEEINHISGYHVSMPLNKFKCVLLTTRRQLRLNMAVNRIITSEIWQSKTDHLLPH